ncbi:MAG: response regulator [Planctomycetota bacterium]|nr:MAG: response regulator [Planctomycetota bacterium]
MSSRAVLRRILLAEDDPNDVELTLTAFEDCRLANRVDVVCDGQEAWDYLTCTGNYEGRTTGLPAVVLMDIKMPKLNGLEVLKRIRETESMRHLPVVMLTSSRMESDLLAGYSLGANAYVVKPVQFDEFAEAVRQLGIFWAVVNEIPPED